MWLKNLIVIVFLISLFCHFGYAKKELCKDFQNCANCIDSNCTWCQSIEQCTFNGDLNCPGSTRDIYQCTELSCALQYVTENPYVCLDNQQIAAFLFIPLTILLLFFYYIQKRANTIRPWKNVSNEISPEDSFCCYCAAQLVNKQKLDKNGFSEFNKCHNCQNAITARRLFNIMFIAFLISLIYLFFPFSDSFFDNPIPLIFNIFIFFSLAAFLIFWAIKTPRNFIVNLFEFRKISSLQTFNYESDIELTRLVLNKEQYDNLNEIMMLDEKVVLAENCCNEGIKGKFQLLSLRCNLLYSLSFLLLFFSLLHLFHFSLSLTSFMFVCYVTLIPFARFVLRTVGSYRNVASVVVTNQRVFNISSDGTNSMYFYFLKNINRIDYAKGVVTFARGFQIFHQKAESLKHTVLEQLGKTNAEPQNSPVYGPTRNLIIKIIFISISALLGVIIPLIIGIASKSFHFWLSYTFIGLSLVPTVWALYFFFFGKPSTAESYYLAYVKDD